MSGRYRLRRPLRRRPLVGIMRRPPVVLGLAFLTALALFIALGLILFSVNPTTQSNQDEIKEAIRSQHAITCAQVQNTANAYRFRSLTPSGDVEPIRHFLTRMQAQQQTLRLARGSECKSAPGFPPVGLQVRKALDQIKRILMSFEPKLREPISRNNGIPNLSPEDSDRQGSFLPGVSRPSHAGIDESGVPAKLHDKLAPSAPVAPQTGRQHKPPPAEEAQPVPPASSDGGEEGATRAVGPAPRPELPTVPVKIEISQEGLNAEAGPEANP